MKAVRRGRLDYLPIMRADGKIAAVPAISYGIGVNRGLLVFSVYVVCHNPRMQNASVHVVAVRCCRTRDMCAAEQLQYMDTLLDAVATQQECELHVGIPAKPKGG